MARQSYKALKPVVVAGKPHAEGSTFTSEPEQVRWALLRGLVEKVPEPKRK